MTLLITDFCRLEYPTGDENVLVDCPHCQTSLATGWNTEYGQAILYGLDVAKCPSCKKSVAIMVTPTFHIGIADEGYDSVMQSRISPESVSEIRKLKMDLLVNGTRFRVEGGANDTD